MQKQTRAVSKSAMPQENLSSVWQPHCGKFNDGVDDIHPDPGAKPEKYGPRFRFLMEALGVKMEDIERKFCKKCKKEHKCDRRLCETCREEEQL